MRYTITLLTFFLCITISAQHTELVKDINQSFTGYAYVEYITEYNGSLYFRADDQIHGEELWISDGTTLGTKMFLDINPGNRSSSPKDFVELNGKLYFSAIGATVNRELWVTDGTPTGTKLLKDIRPGRSGSGANDFILFNNKIYFEANDGVHGSELWVTDGTEEGTQMLKDIAPGIASSFLSDFEVFDNKLYFEASDGVNGEELWVTDGTEIGTQMVKDINPGINGSQVSYLTTYNGKLYFMAYQNATGSELWVTDGTESGTQLFVNIHPDTGWSSPSYLYVFNGKLYFRATDGVNGNELWESDGTVMGTKLTVDILPGFTGSNPRNFATYDNNMYFSASDGTTGHELWVTDGTPMGTSIVKDIDPERSNSSSPADFTILDGKLYFRANGPMAGQELFVTDGTESGTQQVSFIDPSTSNSSLIDMIAWNNQLLFSARDNITGHELWISDGTEAGTQLLKDIRVGSSSSSPRGLTVFNNKVYFRANDNIHGQELWVTDGTEAGTQVIDMTDGSIGHGAYHLTVFNGSLYFAMYDVATAAQQLFKTDGTKAGTEKIDVFKLPMGSAIDIRGIVILDGKMYIEASTSTEGVEIWETDGTSSGSKMAFETGVGFASSNPYDLIPFDSKLFFVMRDATRGGELHVFDPATSTVQLVKDIFTGINSSGVADLYVHKDKLYFRAENNVYGRELWVSDGTEAGTQLFKDIHPGVASSGVGYFQSFGDLLFFRADDGIHSTEVWQTDGTEAGTFLAADVNPTSGSSPVEFTPLGNKLYFRGKDGIHNDELHVYIPYDCSAITSNKLFVTPTGSETNTGTSWAEAVSLQQALKIVRSCPTVEEIWVQQGSYDPGTNNKLSFHIPSNIKLYGGFKGTESDLSERDWTNHPTILSGDLGIPGDTQGNSQTIITIEEKENITIDGFIIEEGNATVENNSRVITDTHGGAMFVRNGSAIEINNCIFRNNQAELGSIISHADGTSSTTFTNCLFYDNTATVTDAIYAYNQNLTFTNCTLINNTVQSAFGVFGTNNGNITLENTIVEGTQNRTVLITGAGVLSSNYSYLKGENPSGTGNIDGTTVTDVLFKDIAAEDFSLQGSSPLIDAGNNSATTVAIGLGGKVRIIDGNNDTTATIDIGAYEFGQAEQTITFNPLTDVTYGDTDFDLTAISDSGLAVTYVSSDTSVATVSGNTVTIVGAGTTTITASQAGNPDFKPATDVPQTLVVNKMEIDIQTDRLSKEIGSSDPTLSYSITRGSLVGSDTFTGSLTRVAGETIGTYAISQGTLALNNNYTLGFTGANFIIAQKVIDFNAEDFSKNATLGASYEIDGFKFTVSPGVIQESAFRGNAGSNGIQAAPFTGSTDKFTIEAIDGSAFNIDSFYFSDQGGYGGLATITGFKNGSSIGSDSGGDINQGFHDLTSIFDDVDKIEITQRSGLLAVFDDFVFNKVNQAITFNNLTDVTYGDTDFNLSASADSGLAISYMSSDTSVATVSGNTITIVGVGSTIITASQAGNNNFNAAASVDQTLKVTPREITITADAGQAKVFGTTEPTLTYSITSGSLVSGDLLNGNIERVTGENVGFYAINQGTLGNVNYNITFVSNDFEITKADQTITFNSLADVTYGDANFNLNATSDSGLTVTYSSSDTSVATVSGNTVTIVGVGTTTITASQVGNGNYNAATDVTQTLTVNTKAITITADAGQAKVFGTTEPTLTYSITSGSLVSGDVLNGNIERVTGENVGFYTINQGTLDNANYDITFVSNNFEITKADQAITFNSLSDLTYGDADFNLNATSDSGLTITYSSSDTSVATVSGSTVTIVGVGTTTITASQAGNGNYNAATDVTQTLTVNQKAITITADAGQAKVFGTSEPTLTYSITSGNLLTGDALIGNIERVTGEDVAFYAINQGTLDNTNYDITFVSNDFEITKADQTITFNSLSDVTYGDADFNLNATSDSGLTITYSSSDTAVATVSGNTVTIVGVGTTTITASQVGNGNYNATTDVTQTLTVNQKAITVTADAGQAKVFGTTEPTLTYSITSGSLVSGDLLNGNIERVTGENVGFYAINQGTLDNVNYDITFVSNDFEINKADQLITFNSLSDVTYGDADFNLNATSNSGLTVTYSSSDTSVATVSGNIVTIVGVGTTTITASQTGNGNYNAAADVTQTLTVNQKAITVTADAGQAKVFGTTEPTLTYSITSGSLVIGDVLNGDIERITGEDVGFYAINQGTLDNANYGITFVSNDFEITKADQAIIFNSLSDVTYGDADFNLNATSDSGLTITYSSSDTSVATISGNTITIVGVGTTTITASQAGNGNYNAATNVTQTLTVNQKAITVTPDIRQSKVFGTSDPNLTYTIISGNLVDSDILSGDLTRKVGENVGFYSIQQGTLTNPNYNISFISNDFEIKKANQTITFNDLVDVNYGDDTFDLTAIASSGLAVTFHSSDSNIATISGNTVTILNTGTINITVSQNGNSNYHTAETVTKTLVIHPKKPLTPRQEKAIIKVYPNPTVNTIQISDLPLDITLRIYTLNGVFIKQVIDYRKDSMLDVSQLPTGVYLLEVTSPNLSSTRIIKKFIKN
ncbi:ELWxxDGT repeat protein [Tenacibaculum agarivorans]|uniref:ELWxxDGT repeat protein n=1 Tax=Tenacibaculum agarivorans TaxID=1908389 RepID=UPI0009FAF946|nr:ELWxxDGT repeat protein [Tenacibaculum agarivorans]